ncbi:MAG: hypothetical protein L6Q66_05325 [Bacteroidia bacterium]|nr:hypothetical protein [Bacteroidia bacterium]
MVCFNHQIKKCNGICCGQEEIEEYNKRVQKVLSAYVYEQPNFALIDKGRTMEERSLVLIKDGCFKGYGYFDEFTSISGIEDVEELITAKEYIPDADDLVKSCMKQKKFAKCIKL